MFTTTPVSMQNNRMREFAAVYLGERKIDSKFRAVISIDVGTTFSGTAILSPDSPNAVNCGAPGAKNTREETKTPTLLLKCPDDTWYFGNEAWEEYKELLATCRDEITEICSDESATERLKNKGVALFRHFKMQLKDKTEGAESLTAKSTMGEPHSLLDLMIKTLEFLSQYALREMKQGWMQALNVDKKDVLWVLTVPAIWNDFGKAFMRLAAFQAGLIPEEDSDHLLLALEPEAASIAVHAEGNSKYGLFKQGTSSLNADLGGGTADITVHKVTSEKPLKLDEICAPTGGPWGGIFVDYQFRLFLYRLFGTEKFQKLEHYHQVDVEDIMDDFRTKKKDFDPENKKSTTSISLGGLLNDGIAHALSIPCLLQLVESYNNRYDTKAPFDLSSRRLKRQIDEEYKLTFSRDQMLEFFEPSLSAICDCIRGLLSKNKDISIVTVVGGYGSSKVVGRRIRQEFGQNSPFNKTVMIPDGDLLPQAAIVQGAAYSGLYTTVIRQRITKYTYGVESSTKWTEWCGHPKDEATWDEQRKEWRVQDTFSRIVKQGVAVAPFESFKVSDYHPLYETQTNVTFPVYRSESYNPKRTNESDCKKIGTVTIPCKYGDTFNVSFTFGPEIRVDVTRQDGEMRSTTVTLD